MLLGDRHLAVGAQRPQSQVEGEPSGDHHAVVLGAQVTTQAWSWARVKFAQRVSRGWASLLCVLRRAPCGPAHRVPGVPGWASRGRKPVSDTSLTRGSPGRPVGARDAPPGDLDVVAARREGGGHRQGRPDRSTARVGVVDQIPDAHPFLPGRGPPVIPRTGHSLPDEPAQGEWIGHRGHLLRRAVPARAPTLPAVDSAARARIRPADSLAGPADVAHVSSVGVRMVRGG